MTSKLLFFTVIIAIVWEVDASFSDDDHDSSFRMSAAEELALLKLFQSLVEEFNSMLALHYQEDHVKFRKEFQVDGILDEDWRDMEGIYPYNVTMTGSPNSSKQVVLNVPLGMWDLSDFVKLSNNITFITRYVRYTLAKILEDANRKAESNFDLGQGALPKFDIVVDLEGMTMPEDFHMWGVYREPVIESAIKALVSMGKAYTSMYRKSIHTLMFVNVPHVSTVLCEWTPGGSFRCRKECHRSGNNFNEVECETFVV